MPFGETKKRKICELFLYICYTCSFCMCHIMFIFPPILCVNCIILYYTHNCSGVYIIIVPPNNFEKSGGVGTWGLNPNFRHSYSLTGQQLYTEEEDWHELN